MREILFRGKDTENGQWIYGYYVGGNNHIDTHEICDINDVLMCMVEVAPKTVGQFTGLTDKNGKRIFEGDICRIVSSDYCGFNEVGKVAFLDGCFVVSYIPEWEKEYSFAKWHNHRFCQVDKWQDYPASGEMHYTYEVIGNIHDNPELLEGEKNA